MDSTTEQPQGRSMRELRAIIAAEDKRRERLMNAWGDLPEADQLRVVEFAEEVYAEVAATQEP